MKKLVLLLSTAALLVACDFGAGNKALKAEKDSLAIELTEREAELNEMMSIFNEIQEGLHQINLAEGRVDVQRVAAGEGSLSAREQIASDIAFIQKQMKENNDKIAKLQTLLKNSKNQSAKLQEAVENMTRELVSKTQRIEDLQAELASKNIHIKELDAAVAQLKSENEAKSSVLASQERALNAAWFVYGTKKELKEQRILTDTGLFKKGKVMKNDDFNKDYFTEIDIRITKYIRLYSKSADLLTIHPEGSYELAKDDKGELTLKITDPTKFWSVSKYLVILVK